MEFFFGFGGWGKKLKKRGKYFSKDYYSSQIKVLVNTELLSSKKSTDNYKLSKSTHNRLVVCSSPTGPTIQKKLRTTAKLEELAHREFS